MRTKERYENIKGQRKDKGASAKGYMDMKMAESVRGGDRVVGCTYVFLDAMDQRER